MRYHGRSAREEDEGTREHPGRRRQRFGRRGLMASRFDPLDASLLEEIGTLERQGPRGRHLLARLMLRGDWRTRTLALSAMGRVVRNDPTAWSRVSLVGRVLDRVPGLRKQLPTVGHRGRLVSRSIANGLVDRCFIVRTAAALALGECRDAAFAPELERLLSDPFRPPRVAAAAALELPGGSAGGGLPGSTGVEPTPAELGEGAPTLRWLELLIERHVAVFDRLPARAGWPGPSDPAAVAAWLAGPSAPLPAGGAAAEVQRYADEGDLVWQRSKPFAPQDRAESLRLLDAFVAAAAHLDVPPGARVLDLGGGPGWVSELLLRLGLTPVTLDLSPSLLELGRDRFARAGLPARFVRSDMTALPFADGSFEAAIVVDALHHVPDVGAALREARRVLCPGGRLVLAEPGEGHSEAEKSRAESRQHGVREGEVHPFWIERLARGAGFDRMSIVPRLPLGPVFAARHLRAAMRQPVERWQVEQPGGRTGFDTLVLQAMLDHPILVLGTGARRKDTRAPGILAGEIRPEIERQGRRLVGHVDLVNTGDTTWLASTPGGDGQVRLGLQLLAADGRLLVRDFARAALEADVPPGGVACVRVAVELPDENAPVELKLDLVAERVCWFEDRGSRAVRLAV
jgi:SAM-dependent methyltransferase